MHVSLSVIAGAVAVIVGAAGAEKLAVPYVVLRAKRPWVESVTPAMVRLVGSLELLAAVGLIAPTVTGIAPTLVPITAGCVAVLMVFAVAIESRHRRPAAALALPTITMILALIVAFERGAPMLR